MALALCLPQGAVASQRLGVLPGFNAPVYAMTPPDSSGTLFLGGDFTAFNQLDTGGGVALAPSSAAADTSFPKVEGTVEAVVADGSGGWYIGGSFTKVGTATRRNAAHLGSDGSVDPRWDPSPDATVRAMAVNSGVVYLAGDFGSVGAQSRKAVAAVGTDGSLRDWNPNVERIGGTPGSVRALAVSGTSVYLGGGFDSVAGQPRSGIAAVKTNGTLLGWNPAVHGTGGRSAPTIEALVVTGTSVYAGGSFDSVAGQARSNVAAVSPSGALQPWRPSINGRVKAIAISGSTLYLGGVFSRASGQPRSSLAAVGTNGLIKPWNPDARLFGGTSAETQLPVNAIAVSGSTVYVGGGFDQIGGESRDLAAALGSDGKLLPFNPATSADRGDVISPEAKAIAVSQSGIYIGGSFRQAGGQVRTHAAAIGADGRLTPWAPSTNDSVLSLLVSGSTVYMAGAFTRVSGQPRGFGAAVSTSGSLQAWDPKANYAIDALAASGSNIHIGGGFTRIAGRARGRLAALSADGTLQAWNPNANGDILTLATTGSTVYAGGSFTRIGTRTRNSVAAISTAGTLLAWDPNPNTTSNPSGPPIAVSSLSLSGTTVYMGGNFMKIGPTSRPLAAAVSSAGVLLPWQAPISLAPESAPSVDAICPAGSTVSLAGTFDIFAGVASSGLASTGTDGAPLAWNPKLDGGRAVALAREGSTLYVAGDFRSVDGIPRGSIAAFDSSGKLLSWGA